MATIGPDIVGNPAAADAATVEQKIRRLQGPILILGASGFIGANLMKLLIKQREDVYGTTTRTPAWRLEDLPGGNIRVVDLLVDSNMDELLSSIKPRTIFDCVAYGAYSFETDSQLIYQTNFNMASRLLHRLATAKIAAYIHAGSSSEYGDNAAGPKEDGFTAPNSHYAVSKAATANLLYYYGKKHGLPCANLRLYSVFGPLEDSSRLIPAVIRSGIEREYPDLANPETSRDFLYVDDCCEAFVDTALELMPELYGESFNAGTGIKTTLREVARTAADLFQIDREPIFSMPGRAWDLTNWYADIRKIENTIGWHPRISFSDGLRKTADWYVRIEDKERYAQSSKKFGLDTKHSVSAIAACYKDGQAIPILYERLKKTFIGLNIDYEIIFVNDCSPDNSEEVIRELSRNDRRVGGISHSRNFGSQAAFRSGMEIASKNSCVLLDGDLQDPPELIAEFVAKWREGFDVVYGRRVKREASLSMRFAYKAFYRVFDAFSYVRIPHDAGDFSLMDIRVVKSMLTFPERDLFLRGVRAYTGFKQTGVNYVRPERMFGVTTNSFWKNVGWAKKGILSYSYVPLTIMSFCGVILFLFSGLLMLLQLLTRLLFPASSPRGATTIILAIIFFGACNLLAISIAGEYLAKVFEEVKRRPHFIRRSIIRDGEVRPASLPAEGDRG
ncbi:MAG: NAD-dependent epimerase/dehydratase family protein [Bryobacteraceae bacterium]